jgi:hypothetical protein
MAQLDRLWQRPLARLREQLERRAQVLIREMTVPAARQRTRRSSLDS